MDVTNAALCYCQRQAGKTTKAPIRGVHSSPIMGESGVKGSRRGEARTGQHPIVVIGGGAAGLVAALFSARAGANVVLLEASKACGLKILVSGGGRCNVLPSACEPEDFFTQGSRNVLKRIFRTWPLATVRRFFESDLRIPLYVERNTAKVFPVGDRARTIRDGLVGACERTGVDVRTGWRVERIERTETAGGCRFRILGHGGERLQARRVVLATGGRSLPKTGSDGAGYDMASELGHEILPPYPALVPLTTGDGELKALAGMALPVLWRATVGGHVVEEREGELLFTHRGFSGPAILDASHWFVRDRASIEVGWAGLREPDWVELFRSVGRRREIAAVVADILPRRLGRLIVKRSHLPPHVTGSNLDTGARNRLCRQLCRFGLPVEGNAGFGVAEVTGGGVALGELRPSTLESRRVAGLHLCGEILDVIGRIGGYNFLWAWVSGRLAGEAAARSE